MSNDPDQLLTPTDVAQSLAISVYTVRAMANDGRLKCLKTANGRRLFRRGDVEALKAEREKSRAAA